MSEGNWSFGDAWISASFAIANVIGGLLAIAILLMVTKPGA